MRDHENRIALSPDSSYCSISQKFEIVNFTEQTVFIRQQDNVILAIPPEHRRFNPDVLVPHILVRARTTFVEPEALNQTYRFLKAAQENNDRLSKASLNILKNCELLMRQNSNPAAHSNVTKVVDIVIRQEAIQRFGSHYSRECNMVFAFVRDQVAKPHPNSDTGLNEHNALLLENARTHTGVLIKVIDNHMEAHERFYYAGKTEVVVPSYQEPGMQDGVYITRSSKQDGAVKVETEHLTFEEAEHRIGLYTSREAARTAGNPDLLLKQQEIENKRYIADLERDRLRQQAEIDQLKRELEIRKIELSTGELRQQVSHTQAKTELDQQKVILDQQKAVREAALSEIKAEAELRMKKLEEIINKKEKKRKDKIDKVLKERDLYFSQLEAERKERDREQDYRWREQERRRRDEFDEKSTNRKVAVDWLKIIPTAALAIAGLFAIFKSSSGGNKALAC